MIQETARLLQRKDNIHILCHASPDGDTLGSGSALLLALRQLGKRAALYCGDPIPQRYAFLLEGIAQEEFEPDFVVSVDVADQKLLGSLRTRYEEKIDLAIDHHASHVQFAKHLCLDVHSAAATEIIYRILQELGAEITVQIATAIYTGVSTDTGCFRYQNTTANSHRTAGAMMDFGAPAGEINQMLFETKTKGLVAAEVAAMSSVEYFHGGICALMVISREMMEKTGLLDQEQDALVGIPRQIEGVSIGITLKEKPEGGFKASVRTNPPMDAAAICGKIGGGGHKGAAGCSITLPLIQAREKILGAVSAYLQEQDL